MTDEQIIKAVGICRTQDSCRGCPYHELDIAGCVFELMKDVFDLINRQKAEIEKLKRGVTFTFTIEDFESIKETIISNIDNKIKSEAIKEFAERLKRYSFVDNLSLNGKETVYVADIDNIIKEMTEVQE